MPQHRLTATSAADTPCQHSSKGKFVYLQKHTSTAKVRFTIHAVTADSCIGELLTTDRLASRDSPVSVTTTFSHEKAIHLAHSIRFFHREYAKSVVIAAVADWNLTSTKHKDCYRSGYAQVQPLARPCSVRISFFHSRLILLPREGGLPGSEAHDCRNMS